MATVIDTEARNIIERSDALKELEKRKAKIETDLATVKAQISEHETEIDKSIESIRGKLRDNRDPRG